MVGSYEFLNYCSLVVYKERAQLVLPVLGCVVGTVLHT